MTFLSFAIILEHQPNSNVIFDTKNKDLGEIRLSPRPLTRGCVALRIDLFSFTKRRPIDLAVFVRGAET